jgi:ATP-dependent DNA ligase
MDYRLINGLSMDHLFISFRNGWTWTAAASTFFEAAILILEGEISVLDPQGRDFERLGRCPRFLQRGAP